jgi:hypothetical protein
MQQRLRVRHRVLGTLTGLLLGACLAPSIPASAAAPAHAVERGPLSGAEAVRIEISEKGAGELGFLIPLPDRRIGHTYPWSEAEVNTVRAGAKGSCHLQVRRGAEDPGHDLEMKLRCGQHKGKSYSTDLRLETTHRFVKRKKALVAEFSHPDGSRTRVNVSVK